MCDALMTTQRTTVTDIDECNEPVTATCGDHAKCENVYGDYNCSCKAGYRPSTGKLQFKARDGTFCQEIPTAKCELNNECIAENINRTLAKIRKIKDPLAILQEINMNTVGEISPVNVISYVEALYESCPLLSTINNMVLDNEMLSNQTLYELVNTVNNFVQKGRTAVWEAIPSDNRRRSLTKLIDTAEQTVSRISQNFQELTEVEINASDLALKVYAFDMQRMDLIQHVKMGGDMIKVFAKKKEVSISKGTVAVVFLRYNNIGSLLSSSHNFSLKENVEQAETVSSSVIAATISSIPHKFSSAEKITFTLKHTQILEGKHTKCAFWNYSEDTMEGNWSTEGCERTHSNSTHTSCRCYHLTHFAVLMSSSIHRALLQHHVSNVSIFFLSAFFTVQISHPYIVIGKTEVWIILALVSKKVKDSILTRITELGIIISLICLSICIFTFWFFSEIQSTRTTIHKNLCCSLFLAELIFLVGINMNSNKLFCSITAGLLHYFLLAAFAWMCIEGIHLYVIVVGVIYNKGFLHKNFYIFGYVSPAVVVVISAALGYKYYGTTDV
ncbi:Adhesion G protein-coupled receptor L4 [Varanus komodoensis]|nr:Adhesion G protein-coupled receptor L4 [Varanus komodoensis]